MCRAGEELFCRCQNGVAATKVCDDDGYGFGACGPCTLPEPEPEHPGAGGGGAGGDGGGSVGGLALLSACAGNAECESGSCTMGYCSHTCASPDECPSGSACVRFDGATQACMPLCAAPSDCDAFGHGSDCGYAVAVDGAPTTACAEWPGLQLPPPGTKCAADADCNVGHVGVEAVCSVAGACATGCHAPSDCPSGKTCSGAGAVGSCV